MGQDLDQSGKEGLKLQIGFDLLNVRTSKPVFHIFFWCQQCNVCELLSLILQGATPYVSCSVQRLFRMREKLFKEKAAIGLELKLFKKPLK